MEENKDEGKKVKLIVEVYSLLIVIVLFFGLAAILAYGVRADNKFTQAASRYIPFPAVIINYYNFISISELDKNLKAVKSFYENQDFSKVGMRVDFSTEDGKKRLKIREKQILNKMIEDKAIEILSRRKGIKINNNLVNQNVERKLREYGSQKTVQKDLTRLYGWNMEDFKEKVVKPDMYKDELEKIAFSESENRWQEPRNKIIKAEKELKNGREFSEVAKTYSEGSTSQEGGDLGWFEKEQLLPKLAEIAFSLEEGKTSGIIESELGYHIIKLEEKKSEAGKDMVKISQIFTRQFLFSDWLEGQMKNMKFFIPSRDYYWDQENSVVEFRDENLKEFEKKVLEDIQGDASMIF